MPGEIYSYQVITDTTERLLNQYVAGVGSG